MSAVESLVLAAWHCYCADPNCATAEVLDLAGFLLALERSA